METVLENETSKILWDFNINTDQAIHHRRPDIVLIDRVDNRVKIIDIAVPLWNVNTVFCETLPLYGVHFTLYVVLFVLYAVYLPLYAVLSTLYVVLVTLYVVLLSLYGVLL